MLDRSKAAAANAPPDTKLKEVGNAIDLGRNSWLELSRSFCSRHEIEEFRLNGLTSPKLDHTMGMHSTQVMVEPQKGSKSSASFGISLLKRGCLTTD